MQYNKGILAVSVVVALALHAGLYLAAPHIYLLKADAVARNLPERFQVTLRPDVTAFEPVASPSQDDGRARPESVRDLLAREDEVLVPEPMSPELSPPEDIEERLSDSPLEREHDFEPDAGVFDQIDAAILEISSQAARDDIDVARRLVRPSPDRTVGADEFPDLRGADTDGGAGISPGTGLSGRGFGSRLGRSGGGTAKEGAGADAAEDRESVDEQVLGEDAAGPLFPSLDVEDFVAREFARKSIERNREFEALDEHINVDVGTYIDPKTGEGYFRLSVNPRSGASIPIVPKEVTFVLDASKSIHQRKLDAAVEGTIAAIKMLRPVDRFNVVIFRDTPTMFRPELVPATPDMLEAARRFLDDLEAHGSTDVYAALRDLMTTPDAPGVADIIFLVSDGKPTGDALAGRDLINALTLENSGHTVYTFGAGKSADRYLLDLLAYRNKGMTYISPRSNMMDDDLPRFFARINEPVLVDMQADYGRIPDDQVYPHAIPDFYRDRPVTVYGRFDPQRDRDVVMRLHGRAGAEKKEIIFKADLTALNTGNEDIAREWAFQKSYYLIGQICEYGDRPEYHQELDRLTRDYGVRTSYSQ